MARAYQLFVLALAAACSSSGGSPTLDAGIPPDADLTDGAPGVVCSDRVCSLVENCCVEQVVPPRVEYFCTEQNLPQSCQGTAFACDGPEDCGEDEVCCGANGSVCVPDGTCAASIVCHNINHCPPGATACAETPLMLLRICR